MRTRYAPERRPPAHTQDSAAPQRPIEDRNCPRLPDGLPAHHRASASPKHPIEDSFCPQSRITRSHTGTPPPQSDPLRTETVFKAQPMLHRRGREATAKRQSHREATGKPPRTTSIDLRPGSRRPKSEFVTPTVNSAPAQRHRAAPSRGAAIAPQAARATPSGTAHSIAYRSFHGRASTLRPLSVRSRGPAPRVTTPCPMLITSERARTLQSPDTLVSPRLIELKDFDQARRRETSPPIKIWRRAFHPRHRGVIHEREDRFGRRRWDDEL